MTKKNQKKLSKKERALMESAKHQEQKKEEKPAAPKKPLTLPFITGVIFVTTAGIFLMVSGFFLFQQIFSARDIAEFLPAKETIALLEIDTGDRNFARFFQELQAYPAFREDALKQILTSETGINFDTDIRPWFGKKAGIAFLNINGDTGRVLFLETKNRKKTPEIAGNSVNFIDRYAVFSENADLLSELAASQKNTDVLSNNPSYLNAKQQLSSLPVFAYGNIELLISRKSLGTLAFFAPLAKVYPSIAFTASFVDGKLRGESFLPTTENSLTTPPQFEKPHDGSLLFLVSEENLLFLMGSRNFPGEFQQTLSLMNTVHPSAAIVAEGMLRAQKDQYLDSLVSLEDDIYPLLRDEYLISVHKTDNGPSFDLVLRLSDPVGDREKLMKLKEAFSRKIALAEPVVKEVVLPDGTKGQELVSSDVSLQEEVAADSIITTLRVSDRDFYYAFSPKNDVFLFSSDKDFVAYVLKSLNSPFLFSLAEARKIASVSDDITVFHPDFFSGLPAFETWRPYLEPFDFLILGKSHSADGVSTSFSLSLR